MNIIKRITAGVLSALTLVGSCPIAHAVEEMGDAKPSGAEITVGETLTMTPGMEDIAATYMTDDGIEHKQWPHKTVLSDGTEIYGFCGDYTKHGVGGATPSANYKVTQRAHEKYGLELYGIATYSTARIGLDTFMKEIDPSGTKLNASTFNETERFIAVQLALWIATGQLKYDSGNGESYSYQGSGDLGYSTGDFFRTVVPRDGKTPSEHLRMWVVEQLLRKGKEFAAEWEDVGHPPWNGGFIAYCPGCEEYDPVKATRDGDSNTLVIPGNQGLVGSGIFTEKDIDGRAYLTLPMSVSSATELKDGTGITVRSTGLPVGSMLLAKDGIKAPATDGKASLTLNNIQRRDDLCSNENTKNGNNRAYGDTFTLCIPKEQAEALDNNGASVAFHLSAEMDVNRYNVMLAESIDNDLQPDILVEPGIRHINCGYTVQSKTTDTPEEFTKLTIAKTDEDGNPLSGCKFQISFTHPTEGPQVQEKETGANGEASFDYLPCNTDVTITETYAPPGYQKLPPQTVNTGSNEDGQGIRVSLVNRRESTKLTIAKTDETGKPMSGCGFQIEYTDTDGSKKTASGESNGSGIVTFDNLPLNTDVTITETYAPEGYKKIDPITKNTGSNADGQGIRVPLVNVPEDDGGGFKVKKISAADKRALRGATFEVKGIDNSYINTFTTDSFGEFTIDGDDLPLGSYQVREISAPEDYEINSMPQTFVWENDHDITLTFEDAPKLGFEIYKYDEDELTALPGAAFDIKKDGQTIASVITDEDGKATLKGLGEGYYQIIETSAPAGYLLDTKPHEVYLDPAAEPTELFRTIMIPNSTKLKLRIVKIDKNTRVPLQGFSFDIFKDGEPFTSGITNENGEILLENLEPGTYRVKETGGSEEYAIDSPDQEIELVKDEKEIKTLTFQNDKKKDYRIKKVDAETGAAIPGVVFEIFRDGQSLGQLPPTDANGEVQLEHTEFGTYNVKEVSVPPEYVKSDETFIMEIDKNSENPFVFTIPNKHKKKLTLKKIDEETGLPMSGVTFDIYLDNNKIDSKTTTNGEIVIENAEPGTYRFEETRTLTGYELLRDPINIEMTADKDVVVTAKNHKRHDLIIYKRDATTHALLDGVTFEIFRDEQSLGDYTTQNGGKIVIENAEPGTYKAIEKSTLKEYILNETTTVIEHTIDKDTTVYIDNTHRPGLGIDKRDSVTNQPLENVQFRITYSPDQTPSTDGGNVKTLGDFFTDANGKINLSTETGYNLDEGWYSVTEVKAPAGYIIKEPATQTVHLADGEYKELSFFNQPKSALVIWKYDARTHEALPGAKFEVRKLEGTGTGGVAIPGSPFTTGTNGSITVTDLEPGAYIVQEIDSPLGYVKDPTPQTVSIGEDEQAVVEVHFANLEDGDVLIKKIDAISKLPLAGVTFDVRKSTGEVVGNSNGKFTTDASGSILIGGVEPDTTLIITEVETISGYILDTTPQTVVTKDGETVFVQFKNQPKGTLIVEKRDSVTNKPMRGVTFKITSATGESTEDNEGLTATNGLYKTDENGQIVLHNLNVGNYIVTETATLPGYRIDDPAPKTVVVPSGGTYTVRFNDTPDGSLIIKKIDSVSRGPLAGVEFEVRMIDGTEFKTQTFTTDKDGLITLANLPEGVYSILETKTIPGYEINREGQEIHIMPGKSEALTFENVPKGGILIKKIDAVTKEPLGDVVFKVTHSDGAVVGASNGEFKTDESGYISIPDLEPDTYIITEIKTKPNYVLDTTPKTIVVKDHRTYTVEFVNQPDGKIIVEKVDSATKKPLEGVEFEIRTSAGELIGDYPLAEGDSSVGGIGTTTGGGSSSGGTSAGLAGQISSNGRYVTDVNGQITINHVRPGTIVITEIKTINGYVKIDKPVTVVVGPNDTQTITIGNPSKGSLLVRKIDAVTKEPIEGVKFKITDSNGDQLPDYEGTVSSNGLYTTDQNGEIALSKVQPGSYVVTEIATVPGYVEDYTSQTVRVDENDAQTLTFTNTPKGSLLVRKIDSVTKKPLEGVEFRIVTDQGELVTDNEGATSTNGLYKTDQNGEIALSKLTSGTYVVTETKTLPGYVLNPESQTVRVNANDSQTLTFTNDPLGVLIIKKMDAATKEPLSDVIFKVTKGDGEVVGTSNGEFRTDESGFITITGITPGTYIVQEIKAKDGYILDDTPKTIEVKDHQTYTLEFFNQPKGGLVIHKIDSVTGKPLQGAEFSVKTSDGQLVPDKSGATSSNGRYVTDAEGNIHITGLKPGAYVVEETKTVSGYIMDDKPQTVTVNANDTQTLTFKNMPKGSLTIRKVDGVTGEPLQGVKFKVVDSAGNVVDANEGATSTNGIYVTDNNGEISIDNLKPDTYVITEVETIPGYVLNTESQTVKVNANDAQVITITNAPEGSLLIKKMDSITKAPLSDVTFKVTTLDGTAVGTSNGEFRTDANGYIQIDDLAPGGYIVQEIQTKDGYILDNTPKTIQVKDHQTYTLEFFNQPKGGLVIHKIDSETKAPLQGVEFTITTSSGELVGANEGKTTSNGKFTTDSQGNITLNHLAPGTYIVTETKALDGYNIDTQSQTVAVNATDMQTLTFENTKMGSLVVKKVDSKTGKPLAGVDFEIEGCRGCDYPTGKYVTDVNGMIRLDDIPSGFYAVTETKTIDGYLLNDKTETVKVTGGVVKEVTIQNDPLGGLLIRVMDEKTKEPLSEATVKVTTPDGTVVGNSNGEYVTDSRGYISIPGLKPGTYAVTQVSTKDGYLIDGSLHNVVIKDDGTYTLDIYNPPMGNLVIRKVDKVTKDPLQGVTFKVTTTGGALVANNGGATSTNGVYTTNASGEIRINKLQPGSYTVTEIETIPGYAKDAPAQTVDVAAGDTQTLTFENTPLGGLLVKTMNAVTGEPLNDVAFKITTLDGAVVGTNNGEFTTDGYGNISITDLQSGGYIVTMIRVKDGFVLDSAPRTIDLKNHETYTLEYKIQPKGGLVIHTVDSLTKEPLQGAKFEVTNSAGELIGVDNDSKTSDGLYTSSASGNIYLNTLQPGTYVVKQIATVSGYTIDSIPQTVLVKAGDVQTLTFENAPGGTLVVRALDSITKKPLSDVGFEVKGYLSTNYPAGSHTTNASGSFRVDGVPSGTYTVTLVKLKDGYYIDETVQTIQVNAAETKELVFELKPLSGLVIKVLDAATKVPIEQSKVKVTTSDGTVVGTTNGEFTTNADGTITIPGLSVGAYIVKQLSVKTGYILNETAQTVEIKDSKSHTVEILNQTRGGILIRRIDAVTKLPVSGISFKVTTSTGELVGTNGGVTTSNGIFTTDENGEILLNMLAVGTYIVTERRLVNGVWIDVSSQTVHVGANDTQTLTFTSADGSTATDGDNAGTSGATTGGLVIRVIDGKTRQPVKNAIFKITKVNGEIVKDRAETDVNGLITLTDLVAGTYIITETKAPDGYTLLTQSTTVIVKGGTPTDVTITIGQALGIQIRDVVKGTQTPLGNCQFEVTKVNGEIIGRYTTDSSGLAAVGSLEDGVYVVKQIACPEAYKLCDGSQNVIVKSGALSTITFENEQHSGIRIKNIDAQTKKGIYHAHFLIRDASGALLGEVTTDQDGYAELDSLVTGGKSMSKILVTMIEAGEGYVLDKTERTLRINLGQVTEMVIESVPILGQIQITVKASALNTITGQVKETVLSGAVFEIINADTNRVVDTITSNASGVAATNPLPLGRYYISQTGAPKFFQINKRKVEAKLKVKGDVVSVIMYNAPAAIRTAIAQKAPQRVSPTDTIRYDITNVCNQANVSLDNFFWHDRIPTDAGRVGTITTGTYNARTWYKITYKTNQNDYRTLADNLLSTNEYTYKIDAGSLKLAKGEYVTDVRYEFGTVPAGFKMVKAAYIYVTVPSYMRIGYGIINRVDAGGSYQGG